jgi:hypothetical protein
MAQHAASLAELAGHDREAGQQLEVLLEAHRRGGVARLRDIVVFTDSIADPGARVLLLVEAVLTLAEQGARSARRAAEDFARAEAAAEAEQVRR